MTWTTGAFRETNDQGFGFSNQQLYNITARVTGVLWYEEEGRRLLHLGFGYSHKFRHRDDVSFSQKPESRLFAVQLVNTGNINSDGVDLIDPELAVVYGPWAINAEYMRAFVAQNDSPNALGATRIGRPQQHRTGSLPAYVLTIGRPVLACATRVNSHSGVARPGPPTRRPRP